MKLKTLIDLMNEYPLVFSGLSQRILQQEAIKWYDKVNDCGGEFPARNFIKEFFNLTDDDLKSQEDKK